ncbi:MAG: hypothetical protein SOR40_07795 [Rothia sp. (in: high G+C Gram-positive bacteria)]|nr:hypothetical protein [Rothia sp. (in: high G+C Gram-positive bacteria)]
MTEPASKDPAKKPGPSRYGRRLEDLSEDERAYYREFLPPAASPDPTPAPPQLAPSGPASGRQAVRGPNRWLWLPHGLTALAGLLAVGSFTLLPLLYRGADHDLLRNYVMLCLELAFFLLVFAALLYGVFMLSRFTDHDDAEDERLIRPTDFADRLYQQGQEGAADRQQSSPADFYDSSWIRGKKDN